MRRALAIFAATASVKYGGVAGVRAVRLQHVRKSRFGFVQIVLDVPGALSLVFGLSLLPVQLVFQTRNLPGETEIFRHGLELRLLVQRTAQVVDPAKQHFTQMKIAADADACILVLRVAAVIGEARPCSGLRLNLGCDLVGNFINCHRCST